jgi:hypothetical protein
MMYYNRPIEEQEIISKAYQFEVKGIEECDSTPNPWVDTILAWEDGETIWAAINEALELQFGD